MIAPVHDDRSFASSRQSGTDGESGVDLRLRVETPENVVLTYTLAGPAVRAGAYLIDLALRIAVLGILYSLLTVSSLVAPHAAVGVMLILAFLSSWFYYTLFEAFWNGRTPGKHVLRLRVIQDKGYPIHFLAAFGRNLARVVDAIGFYLVGFVAMMLFPRFQRLGDLLAHTVVVRERVVRLPREPVILERIEPLPADEVSGVPPSRRTLALIDEFLGRRHLVSIARGHEIARPLARALAHGLRYSGDSRYVDDYAMAFLARVYVTFLRRDEDETSVDPRRFRRGDSPSRSAVIPGLYE